jgi:6-phosphogluconate dehydrogenase
MEIGIIGLGRMGSGIARRLARAGVRVIAYDQERAQREALAGEERIEVAESLADVAAQMTGERSRPDDAAGGRRDEGHAAGARAAAFGRRHRRRRRERYYKDSIARALDLSQHGLRFIDAGVPAACTGSRDGYCLMLGGTPKSIEIFEPYARILAPAPERGWLHCGPSGAGHFAKMIHNGIEYGVMQAYAEGFALLRARNDLGFDLGRLAETWGHGSVIRSWLLDLCADILRHDEDLSQVAPVVADSGEGRWAALEAVELGVPAPVITMALMARFSSQGRSDPARKLLAMMRAKFGGHPVRGPQ